MGSTAAGCTLFLTFDFCCATLDVQTLSEDVLKFLFSLISAVEPAGAYRLRSFFGCCLLRSRREARRADERRCIGNLRQLYKMPDFVGEVRA